MDKQKTQEVKVGQTWIDNDPRQTTARELTVLSINAEDSYPTATCRASTTGRETKVALRRFKPTQTGYRLKGEA